MALVVFKLNDQKLSLAMEIYLFGNLVNQSNRALQCSEISIMVFCWCDACEPTSSTQILFAIGRTSGSCAAAILLTWEAADIEVYLKRLWQSALLATS